MFKGMFRGPNLALFLLLALVFVGIGDRFLPQPLSGASFKTRTAVNQWMVGLIPNWQPKTRPHERTNRAIEREEKGQ